MDPTLSNVALAAVIDAQSDGIAVFDHSHRLALCNPAFRAQLLDPEAGLSLDQLSAQQRDQELQDGLTALAKGIAAPTALEIPCGDGRAISLSPLGGAGFLLRITGAASTAAPAPSETIAPSQLSQLIGAAPINLVIYDLGRERFVYRTPAWEDLYGTPQTIQQIWVEVSDRDAYVAELRENRRLDNFEARFRGRNGRIFPGRVSARLVNHEGTTLSLAATTDMSR